MHCATVRALVGMARVSRSTAWAVASAYARLVGNGGNSRGLECRMASSCCLSVSGGSLSASSVSDPPSRSKCVPFQTSASVHARCGSGGNLCSQKAQE